MFSIYGISGPIFHGSMKELERIPKVTRRPPVSAVSRIEEFDGQLTVASTQALHAAGPEEVAIEAYQAMLQVDLERGPLYHAQQIMQRDVIVLGVNDPVEHAWRVLLEHGIHQAPVLDAGQRLVGIVSERDLLTTLNIEHGRLRDVLDRNVSDVMSTPVVTADPVTDIRRIANVMLTHSVSGVPIVNENATLVGFISRSDVLRAVITDPPLSLWR